MKQVMIRILVSILGIGHVGAVQTGPDVAAALAKARSEPNTVLVLLDIKDRYHVIPVSGITAVRDTNVTVKAGTYSIGDGSGDYPPARMADLLLKKYFDAPQSGNRFGSMDADGNMVSGEIGTNASAITIEVKRILKSATKPSR